MCGLILPAQSRRRASPTGRSAQRLLPGEPAAAVAEEQRPATRDRRRGPARAAAAAARRASAASQSSATSPTGTSRSRSPFPMTRTKPPSSERSSTIEPDRLADPQARRRTAARAAPGRAGRSGRGLERAPRPPRPSSVSGSRRGWRGRSMCWRDVDADQALAVGEPVEAPDARRASPERWSGARPGSPRPAAPRPGREVADGRVRRAIPAGGRAARRREVARGRRGRRAIVAGDEAALDAEVGRGSRRSPGRGGVAGRHVSPTRRGPSRHASRAVEQLAAPRRARRLRAAAEHRGELDDPARRGRARSTSVTVRPSRSRFAIRKWASAWAAICGRWVTHRTWWRRASAHRLRPIGSALRPPIPVSTSSKTSVGVSSASARTCLIASATRDSSPPEAIRASGRAGSPEFGASDEHDLVDAGRVERDARRRRARPPARPVGRRRAAERDVEHAVREAERDEHRADRVGRAPVPPRARATDSAAAAAATSPSSRASSRRGGVALRRRARAAARPRRPPARRGRSPRPRRRRSGARGRRSRESRSSSARELAPGRARRTRPARARLGGDVVELRLEAGEPVGQRLEPRVEPGQAARLVRRGRDRVAGAALRRPRAPRGASRCRGRSPRRAARRRAGPGSRRPRRRAAGPRRSPPPRARASSSRRASSRGSSSQLRERRPVRPPAVDRPGHRRRAAPSCPPNASSRSRCQRSSSRRCCSCWPWISTSGADRRRRAASRSPASSSRRAVDRPVAATSRTAISGSGMPVEQGLDAGDVGAVADERRVGARPESRARAHRSAGSCRRRSRR